MLHQKIAPDFPSTFVTSQKSKKDREQLLYDVAKAVFPYGVNFEITPYSPRHFVASFTGEHISADVDFDGKFSMPSMIHWHKAAHPLVPVSGAWTEDDINASHRRKATSFPHSYHELILMLVEGFSATSNGTAFLKAK